MELGQRIPIYLNGEIQIAWVLEQGLVDMKFIVRTFGVQKIRRDQVITRGPRFHVSFDANAADRNVQTATAVNATDTQSNVFGVDPVSRFGLRNPLVEPANRVDNSPAAHGRYEMMRCKVDSVSLGIMPGRRVAAVRWEGVSEGISFEPESVQQFKNNVLNANQQGSTRSVLSNNSAANGGSTPGSVDPPS